MRTAIVTGACSAIGESICACLNNFYSVAEWCRCKGIDVTQPNTMPFNTSPSVVVHVSETGVEGLANVWNRTRIALINNGGVFIGLSSVHHLKHNDAYAQSKINQEYVLKEMARSSGVRVNCLRLGHIVGTKTWPVEDLNRLPEIPIGRFGTPHDVAQAVLFMVKATWMTGSIITLDGGMSLL